MKATHVAYFTPKKTGLVFVDGKAFVEVEGDGVVQRMNEEIAAASGSRFVPLGPRPEPYPLHGGTGCMG